MRLELYEPVEEFLRTQCNEVDREKVIQKLEDIEALNYPVLFRSEKIEKVAGEMYALRLKVNRISYRFFGKIKNDVMHLSHVIKKKHNKLTLQEITTAQQKTNHL